ncbi:MAG: hypothetical protein ACPHID_02190 [Thermoplasmatota archaeon]
MRLLVCAVMLGLLVPSAVAQLPQGALDLEVHFELKEADVGDLFNATAVVTYHCPAGNIAMGPAVMELYVNSGEGAAVSGAASKTLDVDNCFAATRYVVEFPLEIFVTENATELMPFHFVADMHSSNQQTMPSPPAAHAEKVLKVHGVKDADLEPADALDTQGEPLEEQAPGPAAALVAAGLLALARRRQA